MIIIPALRIKQYVLAAVAVSTVSLFNPVKADSTLSQGVTIEGVACNVMHTPNSIKRWTIFQYDLNEGIDNRTAVYSTRHDRVIQSVACSADGGQVLFSMQERVGEDSEIYQLETSNPETLNRLTDNATHDVDVAMSQDGTVIVWQSELDDGRQAVTIHSQQNDGSYVADQLSSQYGYSQPYLSPNAEWLIMLQHRPKTTNVVRYQLSSGKYTVVATLNNGRQKVASPSISNDGNQALWLETGSEQKLVITDLVTDEREVLLRKEAGGNVIEHPSLMGDGQGIFYSVTGQAKRQTFVQVISTGKIVRIGEALKDDNRYLSNQLHASLTFERFDLNLTATNGLISVSPASDEGYLPGTTLTLTAIGDDGFLLNEWLGIDECGQETTCQIMMPEQNLDIVVEFEVFNLEELRAGIRYCGSDYHSAYNYNGGARNQDMFPNNSTFVALKADGSMAAWQSRLSGRQGAPTDNGYVSIYSNSYAFAALKADGAITAWGHNSYGGSGEPVDDSYISISSTSGAFAALKADGSIATWGDDYSGGSDAPTDNKYIGISSSYDSFAALKEDGSIKAWGASYSGGAGEPTDNGYTSIYANESAFAALKEDGSITAWGYNSRGGEGEPTGNGYIKIYSAGYAFAALKSDGSVTAWGGSDFGGSGAPMDSGYISISSTFGAFAAIKADGSITTWGRGNWGGDGAPTDNGYISIFSNEYSFAALKVDGSITAWGEYDYYWGGYTAYSFSDAPTDKGYISIYSNGFAFAALKVDGSITAWGDRSSGARGAPSDNGYISIYSTFDAFAALKADGSITAWGNGDSGGNGAPADTGYVSINGREPSLDSECTVSIVIDSFD